MSDLVVYCVPRRFSPDVLANVLNQVEEDSKLMSSFNENSAKVYMINENTRRFQEFHQRHFSRIYPKVRFSFQKNL